MRYAEPVTLTGELVTLRPMTEADFGALHQAAQFDELWQWSLIQRPTSVEAMQRYLDRAYVAAKAGLENPFCITLKASGEVIGSTRYLEISEPDRALEIGWTWIRPDHQRTGVNTECKFLLLRHAFETLGAVRVQLKTDGRNTRSQNAIQRIGAQYEGRLRKNRLNESGFQRDTVYYSILDTEWPDVKTRLQAMMGGKTLEV